MKAKKLISRFMVVAFMATTCFSFAPVNAATKKNTKAVVVKPKVQLASVLKKEYSIGEKVFFQVKTPNYSGKVQYTVKLFNSTKNKAITSKYYTDLSVANGAKPYSIGWRISEPGTYFMTIYVKRSGVKVSYDSYVKTIYFLVKKPAPVETEKKISVVLDKEGQVYDGSLIAKNIVIEDVTIKANNVTVKNVKTQGTVTVDPGTNGNADLENVEASKVVVLSGGANSIHLNNTKAKDLEVKSKSNVRIEIKGNTEFEKTRVESSSILEAKAGNFGKVEIAPQNKEDKIVFKGNFKTIEILKPAVIEIAVGSKVEKVEAKSEAKVTIAKDAVVDSLNYNNNKVELTNDGTITKEEQKPSDNTGVVVPPAPPTVYTENDILNNNIKALTTKLLTLNIVNRNIAITTTGLKSSNLETSVIDITLNDSYKDKTLTELALILRDKIRDEGRDIDAVKLTKLSEVLTSVKIGDKTVNVYLADKLQNKPHGATISEFLRKLDQDSYRNMYDKMFSENFDSYSEIVAAVKEVIDLNQEILVSDYKAFGLTIKKVKIGDKTVFDVAKDASVSINDIKTALGIASDEELLGKTLNELVNSYNTVEITFASDSNIYYNYKVNVKLGQITQK
ncbi:hypothetical protein Q428_02580 [Fervidicella metallireducens AeB]|uniref:Uncharacterized protein n=1 Tax=Fervidicella metallireducens AeB TaxID=1403537 RepID=A0A017RXW5_9CLOT|nr:hypothetical protein [Fervidicella metallireducens]EYE89507.1 hypothetical protein Q428_02580 [Fervidicella metallireducens AeB]